MDVVGDELGSLALEYTVHKDFSYIEGGGFSAGVSRVNNSVAHDGDVCEIWVFLFGAELADYFGEGDTLASVALDIYKLDGKKVSVPLVSCPVLVGPLPTP